MLKRGEEILDGLLGCPASHFRRTLSSEWQKHCHVHHVWLIGVVIKLPGFPGPNELFRAHVQVAARLAIEQLQAFLTAEISDVTIPCLVWGCHRSAPFHVSVY